MIFQGRNKTESSQLKEISEEMRQLKELFQLPYLRGQLGELSLENIISNYFPREMYDFQYQFRNGCRVDALLKLPGGFLAIDAKFPLAEKELWDEASKRTNQDKKYQATVKNYMKQIAEKYILPEEGTLPFALVFLPSERLYYNLFIYKEDDFLKTAFSLNVIPVSPASFYLLLQSLSLGLRGSRLNRENQEFLATILHLRKELNAFMRYQNISATHLKNLQQSFDQGFSHLGKMDSLLSRLEK